MRNEADTQTGPPPIAERPSATTFHLEELKLYRAKIEEHIHEVRQSERYALVAMFGFYAWVASQPLPNKTAILFLPVAIPVMLFVKDLAHTSRIKAIAGYIKKLERLFIDEAKAQGIPCVEGFEHCFAEDADHKWKFKWFARLYYLILLLISLVAPFLLG